MKTRACLKYCDIAVLKVQKISWCPQPKIGGNTQLNIYMLQTKFTSNKQNIIVLFFSRNAKKTHRESRLCTNFFTLS